MFARPAIPAAIVGTIATVGWTVQGLGNAFYYRQVCLFTPAKVCVMARFNMVDQIWNHHNAAGHSITKVCAFW